MRHGLAATVLAPPQWRDDVQALAKAIAGSDVDALRLALARQIAEAQLDLMRVQAVKVALMNSQLGIASPAKAAKAGVAEPFLDDHLDVPTVGLLDETAPTQGPALVPTVDTLRQLARLERYERRAIARSRRAARAFITHQRA